jgi:predicted alpha/beta hydrolase
LGVHKLFNLHGGVKRFVNRVRRIVGQAAVATAVYVGKSILINWLCARKNFAAAAAFCASVTPERRSLVFMGCSFGVQMVGRRPFTAAQSAR